MTGSIDIVCNLFDPETVRRGQSGLDNGFKRQIRLDRRHWRGMPMSQYLRKMDRAGIERSLLIATRAGDLNVRGSFEVPYERVWRVCRKWPDRFSGLAGIDPTRGMQGLADLTQAVREYGFVGGHLYPHWFGLAPDHARCYPYYAKCAELDVPVMMQVGQNLIYSKTRRLPTVARPILLDSIAIDFPELRLIGIHIGVPWTDEMISMCWKHPNVYTAGDAYAPCHWPTSYVHYANTYGREKVLFGTDWPVVDPERAIQDVAALSLRPDSQRMLLRDNALRVFRLPGWKQLRANPRQAATRRA
jgi:uncharacterized protein